MDFNRFSGGMFLHETVGRDITINNQVRISNILSGSDQDGINERWGVFEGCPGWRLDSRPLNPHDRPSIQRMLHASSLTPSLPKRL
ncbi:hypothetical protein EYZ11_009426 [Aspergillus tanneri]|uniref:Uncharacterized protein n=1 Tax=Aspergillus tanneri TaxID=1220188 RepID=A0A4S3J8D4_9EURO|nr:hypothetical protein EYZ11_009426 [Aspergillus tanneri]